MFNKLAILSILYVALMGKAQTSLYIPGFEPQPVSADNIGVGSDGRTTWVIHKGEATDMSSHSDFGTATLVEGPHDASFTYANSDAHFTIGQRCSFSQSLAVCTAEMGGSTAVFTEMASPVPIQTGLTNSTSSVASSRTSASLSTSGTTGASISTVTSHPSDTTESTGTLPSPSVPANSSAPLMASNLVIAAAFTTIFCLLSYQAI